MRGEGGSVRGCHKGGCYRWGRYIMGVCRGVDDYPRAGRLDIAPPTEGCVL